MWLQRSHTRRCGYNSKASMRREKASMLQRSHTRRCGYNFENAYSNMAEKASKEPHPKVRLQLHQVPVLFCDQGFKGATPEGAVTTFLICHPYESQEASKEPHPKVRLQRFCSINLPASQLASKEPHPKVRLQLLGAGSLDVFDFQGTVSRTSSRMPS